MAGARTARTGVPRVWLSRVCFLAKHHTRYANTTHGSRVWWRVWGLPYGVTPHPHAAHTHCPLGAAPRPNATHAKATHGNAGSARSVRCASGVALARGTLQPHMPTATKQPCRHPGCRRLVHVGGTGRCTAHQRAARRAQDAARPAWYAWYGEAWWRRESKLFLRANPVCMCGCGQPANVVDHDPPHKGDRAAFMDAARWRPMTKRCHDRKTYRQDGAFGKEATRT